LGALTLQQSGSFISDRGVEVRWYNYTDYNFIQEGYMLEVEYFDSLAHSEYAFFYYPVWPETRIKIPYQLGPELDFGEPRVLFMVPEGAPQPAWELRYSSFTTTIYNGVVVQVVREGDPVAGDPIIETRDEEFQRAKATESCHAGLNIRTDIEALEAHAILGNEVFCNSAAYAFVAVQKGLDIGVYTQRLNTKKFGPFNIGTGQLLHPDASGTFVKAMLFGPKLWEEIPVVPQPKKQE